MCGLVGVAGTGGPIQDKVFEQLLHIDVLRGRHSTGILFVANNKAGTTTVLKEAVEASVLMQSKDYNKEIMYSNKVLLGHNRYATVGDINSTNAHPFEFSSLVGAHNGTLRYKHELPDSSNYEVDSENLYHSIDKIGLESTYELLQGAWALSWWDTEEQELNFIRNKERPMSYCFSQDGTNLYWASEAGMLTFVLDRCKVRYQKIVTTKPHQLYKLKVSGKGILPEFDITDLSSKVKVKVYPIRKKQHSPSSFNQYDGLEKNFVLYDKKINEYNQWFFEGEMYSHPYEKIRLFIGKDNNKFSTGDVIRSKCTSYNAYSNTYNMTLVGATLVDENLLDYKIEDDEDRIVDTVEGFDGEMITKEEMAKKCVSCVWCGDPLEFSNDLTWTASDSAVCAPCMKTEEAQMYATDLTTGDISWIF